MRILNELNQLGDHPDPADPNILASSTAMYEKIQTTCKSSTSWARTIFTEATKLEDQLDQVDADILRLRSKEGGTEDILVPVDPSDESTVMQQSKDLPGGSPEPPASNDVISSSATSSASEYDSVSADSKL